MANHDEDEGGSSPQRVEMVVRTLRHEIGDLLQSVYSAVAILQERLPGGQGLERTILSDLRGRAEVCKNELDAAHDLICPLELNLDWADLGELAAVIASSFSLRLPSLQVVCEVRQPLRIWGDPQRLMQAGTMLMIALSQVARKKIEICGQPLDADRRVAWIFHHDGPAPNAEQLRWLEAPFSTTRYARFGLGLALARRIAELHGGHVSVRESEPAGFQIALVLPSRPAQQ